jgi:ElaB/YqjD/DUF883 family membrane-anchored ribosome-binding protein
MTGTGARDTAAHMSDKAHAGVDRLSASAHQTIDKVASAATSAADRFGVTESRFAHNAQEFKESTCAYVRAHPMTAVGIAVAAGYLLSRLTSFR